MANPTGAEPYEYAIDIHTIPSGVPLHEEPKPVPRPCTKEFALAHPMDSEWRMLRDDRAWSPISGWAASSCDIYEFRTTAPEEKKSRVVAEIQVESLVNGFYGDRCALNALTIPITNGVRSAITFESTVSCFDVLKVKNPRLALIVDEEP